MITSWRKLGFGLAAGMVAIGGATAANAVTTVVPINTSMSPNSPYFVLTNNTGPNDAIITASFASGTITAGSSFDYTFAFRLAQDGLGSGDLSASWAVGALALNITSVLINGAEYISSADAGAGGFSLHVDGIPILNWNDYPGGSLDPFASLDGWNTIQIIGTSTGTSANSFNGNVTFAAGASPLSAVPEPAAWAMMLCGFGLVGFAMRQRRVDVRLA